MMKLFCIAVLCLAPVFGEDRAARQTVGEVEAVRLVGSSNARSGRVEILSQGEWGTVCGFNFDDNAARVVCRSLGLPTGATRVVNRNLFAFADRGASVLLDRVACDGSEASLNECRHGPIGDVNYNCNHYRDVGIMCGDEVFQQVRLVGGVTAHAGRLEVLSIGVWGTVCADSFDNNAGSVICRSLGFPNNHRQVVLARDFYGIAPHTTPILLDDVTCHGNESTINACGHRPLGVHGCEHVDDVGVACGAQDVIDSVRLVGGPDDHTGRLEILSHGAWGTVCNDYFTINAAQVVCRSLGFSTNGANVTAARYLYPSDPDTPVLLDDVRCQGHEASLNDCQHRHIGEENCYRHTKDVAIICR